MISGSLHRQRDTATAIADAHGAPLTVDERWDEYDADPILAHHSASPQRLEHPAAPETAPSCARAFQTVLEHAQRGWITAGGGSPTPETWPAFADRVSDALSGAGAAGPGMTVVVSSGGVIAALGVALLGADPLSFMRLNRVCVNCAITRVIVGSTGTTLVSFNEQQHLDGELLTYR